MTTSVNKDQPVVPTWDAAAAEAYVTRRHAEHLIKRAATGVIDGALVSDEYLDAIKERDAAAARLEVLLHARVAHELTWCHDVRECPICAGEVSL
jgi:hypothetical protein